MIDVRAADGLLLHVRSALRARPGDAVELSVPAERVLVYPSEDHG